MMQHCLLLVSLFAFLAVQVFSGPAKTFDQQGVRPPEHSTPLTATDASQQSVLKQADAIFEQMSRITGLPIRAPLKKRIVGRAEVRKFLVDNLHAEYTPREIHVQSATLKALGLVSPDFDLEKFLISFYTEQAAGFYDPRTKTMYMANWVPSDTQQMVLAHELTHALQDQNFDLQRYMHAVKNDDDQEAARQAVVEGYATAAMFQRMVGSTDLAMLPSFASMVRPLIHQQMAEFPVFSSAPLFFRLQALFPYIQGASFIQEGLQKAGGWKALNILFTAPPTSTKAIYQPENYFDHSPLPQIQLPATNPLNSVPGLTKLDENTLGELSFNELLGQFLSEQRAKTVSKDWIGDRYILYENRARRSYALLARSRWANPEDALTFFRDYHAVLVQKYAELTPDSRSTPECFVGHTSSGDVILSRTGDEVRWAEGVPASKVPDMLKWLNSL